MKIVRFLKFAWKLLKYNIGTLLVFEILYKFTMIAIFRPVLMGLWRLSLRVRGLSFLSDETIGIYLKGPAIWIILLFLILCLTFFTLLDISCIITCLHASYRKQKIPLLALIRSEFFFVFAVNQRSKLANVCVVIVVFFSVKSK